MPTRRLPALIAAAALVLLGLVPSVALAADGPDVAGTVTLDGAPVGGATVTVTIAGNDMAYSAVTDATGAWSVTVGVAAGETVVVQATGPTTTSQPDAHGCVTISAWTGKAQAAVESLPLSPLEVVLDTKIQSTVCSATAMPRPVITPPATDAPTSGGTGGGDGFALLAIGLAACALLAAGLARRPVRRG